MYPLNLRLRITLTSSNAAEAMHDGSMIYDTMYGP